VLLHASPRGYAEWLENAMRDTVQRFAKHEQRLVFINAWNEWAEGAYLEPDARLGYAYLEATRRAVRVVQAQVSSVSNSTRSTAPERVSVVIHAFYPELLDEMLRLLSDWDVPYRVVVTTAPERVAEVKKSLARLDVSVECLVFENRGRDIVPFMRVANELLDADEELVLKLHTKRSPRRGDGDVWRRDLLLKLLEPSNARRIFNTFREDPQLGIVFPEGHILSIDAYWGSNEANVRYLCRRMDMRAPDPTRSAFGAGSMFYVRLPSLRPLLDAHLDEREFEPEAGQVDGTMAHAIERCFGLVVQHSGYRMASSANPSRDALDGAKLYPFAESPPPGGSKGKRNPARGG
jgi:lipopolysaccharide biosynthesis protein